MATPLELVTERDDDGITVLAALGQIDMTNATSFRAALSRASGSGTRFVVDLTGVDYLDSAGVTAMLPYFSRLGIVATAVLAPVLAISGFSPITTIVATP